MKTKGFTTHQSVHGFTLIELLVVIGIMAILAGILLPVFAQAREKARAISCVSNLKQLALAYSMYADDYDERYPFQFTWWRANTRSGFARVYWPNIIYSYVKSTDTFICPTSQYKLTNRCVCVPPGVENVFTSFGVNCRVMSGTYLSRSYIKDPSGLFMLADSRSEPYLGPHFGGQGGVTPDNPDGNPSCLSSTARYVDHHSGGVNVAFYDGHIKWYSSRKFWASSWDFWRYQPWSNTGVRAPGW